MKTTLLFFVFACLTNCPLGQAQTNQPARGGTNLVSPLIETNRQVRFRLRAPEAKTVTLTGDFLADTLLNQDASGLWSVTVGPVQPDIYFYSFLIDGVRTVDPGNPNVKIGFTTSTVTSLLEVR